MSEEASQMVESHEETCDDMPTLREIMRAGCLRPQAASQSLQAIHDVCACARPREILADLTCVIDPDSALQYLAELSRQDAQCVERLLASSHQDRGIHSLLQVLGASSAMGVMMRNRPALMDAAAFDSRHTLHMTREERRNDMLDALSAYTATVVPSASSSRVDQADDIHKTLMMPVCPLGFMQAVSILRACYREHVAAIMAADLASDIPEDAQPSVSRKLSDAADAVLEGALAIARGQIPGSSSCRFSIIAMGKLGAQEINYVSDIDLIYVVEPSDDSHAQGVLSVGSSMAIVLQKVCQSVLSGCDEPPLWKIDTALRPEGKDGPLVRRLASHEEYYHKWASSWEFQALLKARPCAGDVLLGCDYQQMIDPLIWQASHREHFVADCQHMRQRVESLIPFAHKDLDIKLGRGGLRDVEFAVQMLQLVHGGSDISLRVRDTLGALDALASGGYIARHHASILSEHYRFERVLEHRQQMWLMRRTHLFPDLGEQGNGGLERTRTLTAELLNQNEALRRLARALHTQPEELVRRYDQARREIRHLHKDIYYRPMLPINAQLGVDPIELSPQAARERFLSIGFADPQAAMRHVQRLTHGLSRAAKIHRILLPAVLQWLGEGQNPDMGLLAWSHLAERFGGKNTYLGFLRDSPSAAQRLCHVLANSRYLGDTMKHSMQSITWLGDDMLLHARSRESLMMQVGAMLERYADCIEDFAQSLRALRRQEIERIALAWSCNVIDTVQSMQAMSDVFDVLIDAALKWAVRDVKRTMQVSYDLATFVVLALGRYGGREINFCSDADIMMVYRANRAVFDGGRELYQDDEHRVAQFTQSVVDVLRNILQGPVTLEPKIDLDFDLRPEGKDGPLIRSFDSCKRYYQHWASVWEHQALLRARVVAGDESLGVSFLTDVVNPIRYASSPITQEQLTDIRKLKARMEAERLPRGVRYDRHLKLGRGGLSDIEWSVQLLQLRYAYEQPSLQVTGTLDAIAALVNLKLLSAEDAQLFTRCWSLCSSARNAHFLWSGSLERADIIPTDSYSLSGMAVYLHYDTNQGKKFENDLMALMRQCREVMVRIFYM